MIPSLRGIAAAATVLAVAGAGTLAVLTPAAAAGTPAPPVQPRASSPSPSPSAGGPVYNCSEPGTAFTRSIPMTVTVGYEGGDLYSVTLTSGPGGLGGMAGSAQYPDFQSFLPMTGAQSEGIDLYGGYVAPSTQVFTVAGEVALYTPGTDYFHFPGQFTMRPATPNGSVYLLCNSAVTPPPVAVSFTPGSSPAPSSPAPSSPPVSSPPVSGSPSP